MNLANPVSQSGNILAVGAYKGRPGGLSDAGGGVYLQHLSLFRALSPETADGDGFSDLQEANASTDPDSNTSFPTTQFGLLANYSMDGNLTDLTGNDYNGSALELSRQSDRFGIV